MVELSNKKVLDLLLKASLIPEKLEYLKNLKLAVERKGENAFSKAVIAKLHVAGPSLDVYDIWNNEVVHSIPITVDQGSRWVFLEDNRVFCCGAEAGYSPRASHAYILEESGRVTNKHSMNRARWQHGLIAIKTEIYVFGGRGPYLLLRTITSWTSECFRESTNTWNWLNNMPHEMWDFNPCQLGENIFLCGNGHIVAFSSISHQFADLRIPLRDQSPCCVYVKSEHLMVHSRNYVMRFAVEAGGLRCKDQSRQPEWEKSQNSQPVVDLLQERVYMVAAGKCVFLDMKTGNREEVS